MQIHLIIVGCRCKMERYYQEQLDRIDRLMQIIGADNPEPLIGSLLFYDIVVFTCQSMWHLKDWILNDVEFGAKDMQALSDDIHSEKCLLICADLANGSKHLSLHSPKTGFSFSASTGVNLDTKNGIYKRYYYALCSNTNDPFYGVEIRDLLTECRTSWNKIIDKHYLSKLEF